VGLKIGSPRDLCASQYRLKWTETNARRLLLWKKEKILVIHSLPGHEHQVRMADEAWTWKSEAGPKKKSDTSPASAHGSSTSSEEE
jgi:hypothetical protein